MTNVLVTGARGFVGKALLPELLKSNVHVKAITREKESSQSADIEWIPLTIKPDVNWSSALEHVTCVIHLADGMRAFEKIDKNSPPNGEELILATLGLARAAAKAGVKRFVYVSSIKAAAGETADKTLDETLQPSPETDYGRMKLATEQALQDLLDESPMELTIIRNPIVYGPGGTNNMARLLKLADTPWPMPFRGLENRRSIISAKNLASALTLAAMHPDPSDGVFFVHDGDRLSTGEIISIFRENLGRPVREIGLPQCAWNSAKRLPIFGSIARRLAGTLIVSDVKFRSHFHWSPPETSESALADMAQAYKSTGTNE